MERKRVGGGRGEEGEGWGGRIRKEGGGRDEEEGGGEEEVGTGEGKGRKRMEGREGTKEPGRGEG